LFRDLNGAKRNGNPETCHVGIGNLETCHAKWVSGFPLRSNPDTTWICANTWAGRTVYLLRLRWGAGIVGCSAWVFDYQVALSGHHPALLSGFGLRAGLAFEAGALASERFVLVLKIAQLRTRLIYTPGFDVA
jgi:hypothetical protein